MLLKGEIDGLMEFKVAVSEKTNITIPMCDEGDYFLTLKYLLIRKSFAIDYLLRTLVELMTHLVFLCLWMLQLIQPRNQQDYHSPFAIHNVL